MAEEKPTTSLSTSKDSTKTKNPFSRVQDSSLKSSSIRKSWSTDSLSLLSATGGLGKYTCICAPTKHEGSFRCRLHRASPNNHGGSFDASNPVQLLLPKPSPSSPAETNES